VQGVAAGGRGHAAQAPGRPRGRGRRRAGRIPRRDRVGIRQPPARDGGNARGAGRLLPRGAGRLQVPPAHRGAARPAEDAHRQAAAQGTARPRPRQRGPALTPPAGRGRPEVRIGPSPRAASKSALARPEGSSGGSAAVVCRRSEGGVAHGADQSFSRRTASSPALNLVLTSLLSYFPTVAFAIPFINLPFSR